MTLAEIVTIMLVGAIAGGLAGIIMGSKGGLIRNIIIGIAGGFIGSYVFTLAGISWSGTIGTIGTSLIGSCLLIFVGRLIFR